MFCKWFCNKPAPRGVVYQYWESFPGVFYPTVKPKLEYRQRKISPLCLIDSGATYSIFHSKIAEKLRINLTSGDKQEFSGVGGVSSGYLHKVTFTLAKKTFKAPVVFTQQLQAPFSLLGRTGIFDQFFIEFNEKEKRVEFRGEE